MSARSKAWRWFQRDRLSWRLGLSIALLVVLGQAAGFFLVYRYSHDRLLTATREHATLETWLIRQALEYQMLTRDDGLIRRMVDGFARGKTVERVMILDRTGRVKFSSDPRIRSRHFDESSPTCQVCHRQLPSDRQRSTMLELDGGRALRCVQPILNRGACHQCHPAEHRINGVIVVDVPLGKTLAELERSVGSLAVGTSAIGLALLGGIGLVVRRLILKRLVRFAATARAIAAGDLGRRVPAPAHDALGLVERHFNHMADTVTGLLGQVRQQQASLERVMNSVDDGLVVLDRSRSIVAANEAFRRRFPSSIAGLTCRCCEDGEPATHFGCPDEVVECPTLACFARGSVQTVVRTRALPDGSRRQEEVRSSPVQAEDGSIRHVVEVWRDITDRRSAEARLADHERMVSLGRLASGFSHEVNTPLASIGTCLDGIRRLCDTAGKIGGEGREMVEQYARIASTQVQRCGTITEQFLKLARGKSLARETVDLTACAELVTRLCKHAAGEAGARVEVVPLPGLPSVVANEAAVQQVLLNLMLNALEAGNDGQELKVVVSFRAEPEVAVVVRDDGRGIASEDLGRIFEPFFTRRVKGTGLGLFVSMNLARSWGGDILVESQPGRGTAFTVLFPLRPRGREGVDATEPGSGRR